MEVKPSVVHWDNRKVFPQSWHIEIWISGARCHLDLSSWTWQCVNLISVLLVLKAWKIQDWEPGLHRKFQSTQGYIVRPCRKTKQKEKQKTKMPNKQTKKPNHSTWEGPFLQIRKNICFVVAILRHSKCLSHGYLELHFLVLIIVEYFYMLNGHLHIILRKILFQVLF